VSAKGKTLALTLTPRGLEIAEQLRQHKAFGRLADHMSLVKKHLGSKSGTALKSLIYRVFEKEVAQRQLGEEIK
jgi:hypothetical protein